MSEKLKLTCRLKHHVVTDEGDFIPEGTPVQVVGWTDDGNRIEVRTSVYVYPDTWNYEAIVEARDTGAVNDGLFLSVLPESLVYLDCQTVKLMPERRKVREAWAD
jgi:hypothetical protein